MMKPDRQWRTTRFLVAATLATTFFCLGARSAIADGNLPDAEPVQNELDAVEVPEAWLISTRCVPLSCPAGVDPERFSYQVSLEECPRWNAADADAFFEQSTSDTPVVVFVHGNRTDRCDAITESWPLYRQLLNQSAGHLFRFVIWSWPAEQTRVGPRRDALIKASRSDTQSFYLASWLDRLPPETPVTLIGYSFGARVITGALHLAEGGTLLGMQHETGTPDQSRRPVRVVLVAAALDCEWLLPGSRNGLAGRRIEQMMVTRNCGDRGLRFYPRMRRNDSSSALGATGPASPTRLAESGLKFETVPVESQVGRDHLWHAYLRSSAVRSRLAWYSFLLDESTSDERSQ